MAYKKGLLFFAFISVFSIFVTMGHQPLALATAPKNIKEQAAPLWKLQPLRNPFQPLQPPKEAGAVQSLQPQGPLLQQEQVLASYRLSYLEAKALLPNLEKLLPQGKLVAEPLNNTLLYRGTLADHKALQDALKILDQPSRQITLEAKFLALNHTNSRELGLSWAWDNLPQTKDSSSGGNSYQGRLKFYHGYSFNFHSLLRALLAKGKAKVLATPSIITIPGKEASIFIGDHIPVQTEKHSGTSTYTTTEYIDAGIKLKYTPLVSSDGKLITATVHTEVSTPTLVPEVKNYRVTSRTASTTVRMFNGETLVLGGLINEEEQEHFQALPLLSKLPLLGGLFKSKSKTKAKTEVLLLLTPHLTEAGASPAIYGKVELPLKEPPS